MGPSCNTEFTSCSAHNVWPKDYEIGDTDVWHKKSFEGRSWADGPDAFIAIISVTRQSVQFGLERFGLVGKQQVMRAMLHFVIFSLNFIMKEN